MLPSNYPQSRKLVEYAEWIKFNFSRAYQMELLDWVTVSMVTQY